jgi:hypothetical protein
VKNHGKPQDSRFTDLVLNSGCSEYDAALPATRSRRSMLYLIKIIKTVLTPCRNLTKLCAMSGGKAPRILNFASRWSRVVGSVRLKEPPLLTTVYEAGLDGVAMRSVPP